MKVRENFRPVVKWFLYSLLLLLCYILQTIPGLFEIFGIKPVLIAGAAFCVSMYEGPMVSAVYSMTAGLLWDISSDKLFGFNGIIFLIFGLFISLICIYYLHTKLLNSLMFCGAAMISQGFLDYLFYYSVWNYDNVSIMLVRHILPTIAYTLAVIPVFYFLVRRIAEKCNIGSRI